MLIYLRNFVIVAFLFILSCKKTQTNRFTSLEDSNHGLQLKHCPDTLRTYCYSLDSIAAVNN